MQSNLMTSAAMAFMVLAPRLALAEPQETASTEALVVTATRVPEPADQLPAYITSISGADLRTRGAQDLRSALSLVAGVEAPGGGDSGPAGAVPSLWGLHEFDAFLLVVDGVPWGGAFNPAIPTLDLNDVERIEVLKGSAPVIYGATSFVGVIQVIHYPAGKAANEAQVGYGSHGSWRARASMALAPIDQVQQSIAVDAERLGYAEDRQSIRNVRALYRLAAPLAGGALRLDLDLTLQQSRPPSPIERVGDHLTGLTPINANYNPSDARIDENRYHGVLGYTRDTPLGAWETTASFAYSHVRDVRGFLRPDLNDDGSANADSQAQRRNIADLYADTHLGRKFGRVDLVYGADLLFGEGRQQSANGEYYAPLSGFGPVPSTRSIHVDEDNGIADRRVFVGQYVQLDWKPDNRWDINAGVRLNETHEHKISTHVDGFDPSADTYDVDHRNVVRGSGAIGVSYRAWRQGSDEAVLFADYRNTFKPAANDFGPDVTPAVLKPEAARSYEAGVKGRLAGGRLEWQAGVFLLNFSNLVVATTDADGDPLMQNAGGERLKGVEIEARYQITSDLSLTTAASYHDATFTHYVAEEGGANVDVAGNQLTLSPHVLASAGLLYQPASGIFGSLTANYIGRRYLDLENQAPVGAYATADASLGYRWGRYRIALEGYNLSDQRPPVTASEFGDQSYYLLPGRSVFLSLGVSY